ncbi:MAG TPA: pyruvate:ferredoxin (flavodoxin) oxidoreductase, partial [Terriglobales bacterium]|nr:pyruvate:ferredoxin (flavodoxin) oxidoreductase [Terriglobales bacterium]
RFGPRPIHSPYLIERASFVACHQPSLLGRNDMLKSLEPGGTFLLNAPISSCDELPPDVRHQLAAKNARLFVIDASRVARECGMGNRINTIMQVCFFACTDAMPFDAALDAVCAAVRKTYARKGESVVEKNLKAVDAALANLHELAVTDGGDAVEEVRDVGTPYVLAEIIAGRGDDLPVSAMPFDGTFPTGTAKYEKRNLALDIPVWETASCIQCGKCAMVCPHSVIRIKAYDPARLANAPATFKACDAKDKELAGLKYTIQVAPEDCTGCAICVDICPVKNKQETRLRAINMEPQPPLRVPERENWEFFLKLPELDRRKIKVGAIRSQQIQEPLFEFSGACSGCGETPYLKLLSQLFGDRALIANATGCSSIYGGNLPTTPWTKNSDGRGPVWSNSLFEDNAEFGLGFRLSIDKQTEFARELVKRCDGKLGPELIDGILNAPQKDESDIYDQRIRVAELKDRLKKLDTPEAKQLLQVADMLVKKSVWIVGGDGWAYDIGYGGLDHVIASGKNVNLLVLDTEVYSNTGGQQSKATPRAAVAKFAAGGKPAGKKDLGMMAMAYGNVYVASVAMGAKDEHTLKAFLEAEAYDGPSIIIAYAHCIAHGIDMTTGMQDQKAAVDSGEWLLYRYHPDRAAAGENPLQLDSRAPTRKVQDFMQMETRFKMLTKSKPEDAKRLWAEAQHDAEVRYKFYEYLAQRKMTAKPELVVK